MLAPLLEAGFTARSAVDAVSAAQIYAFGFALAQRSHSRVGSAGGGPGSRPDRTAYPRLNEVAAEYRTDSPTRPSRRDSPI
jgi:hypothetical protein